MFKEGVCQHSPRNQISWCRHLRDFCVQSLWQRSPGVDKTRFNDLWFCYRVIYGSGTSRISLLEAATNSLNVSNSFATMAREEGRVQLEQSDMWLALNMDKVAKGGFSHAALEEMKHLLKTARTEVREEKKWGVEFPGHTKVKAALERHLAMVYKNYTHGCLPCQNGTAKNPQTCWRRKGTGGP